MRWATFAGLLTLAACGARSHGVQTEPDAAPLPDAARPDYLDASDVADAGGGDAGSPETCEWPEDRPFRGIPDYPGSDTCDAFFGSQLDEPLVEWWDELSWYSGGGHPLRDGDDIEMEGNPAGAVVIRLSARFTNVFGCVEARGTLMDPDTCEVFDRWNDSRVPLHIDDADAEWGTSAGAVTLFPCQDAVDVVDRTWRIRLVAQDTFERRVESELRLTLRCSPAADEYADLCRCMCSSSPRWGC